MRTFFGMAALALFAAACGSDDESSAAAPTACTAANATATAQITMSGNRFQPACAKAPAGTLVTFDNDDAELHTVTANPGQSETFNALVAAGAQFTHTFSTAGTFGYRCTIHAGMAGAIVVE